MAKWQTKPPPGVQIDRGHSLSAGLIAAYLLNEGAGSRLNNAATGKPIESIVGSPAWVANGLQFTTGTTQYAAITTNQAGFGVVSPTLNWSIHTCVLWNGVSSHAWSESGAGTSAFCRMNALGSGNNQLSLSNRDDAAANSLALTTPTASFFSGRVYNVCFTQRNRVVSLYLNGVLSVSGTQVWGAFTANQITLGASRRGGSLELVWDGQIYHQYKWNRALSAAEVAQLSAEPYCMFRKVAVPSYYSLSKKVPVLLNQFRRRRAVG